MDHKILRKYQLYRVQCNYREDKKYSHGVGAWCKKHKTNCYIGVCDEYNTHPSISNGKQKSKKGGSNKIGVDGVDTLTERETEALKLHNQKLSLIDIGDRMGGITKQRVSVLIRSAKKKLKLGVDSKGVGLTKCKGGVDKVNGHELSWHGEEVTIDIVPINILPVKTVKWSNTEYWNKDTVDYHIQLFKDKVKVTFKREILGFDREKVKLEAERRCKNFLKGINRFLKRHSFPKKIVLEDNGRYLRVKRHWAIKNTGLGKRLERDKGNLYVYDRETGELLLYFDKSDPGGHIETDNVKKGDVVVDKTHRVFDEYLHDDVYSPKETTDIINKLISNVSLFAENSKVYAENIELHLSVLKRMEKTLRKMEKKL